MLDTRNRFFQLTPMLDKYIGEDKLSAQVPVKYFSTLEQQKHEFFIEHGLLFDTKKHLMSTIDSNLSGRYAYSALYVMSEDKKIYAVMKSNDPNVKINHSSLLAGKKVICAGFITVVEGKLKSISNESGHYQPNAIALYSTLEILRDAGIDINNLEVRYQGKNSFKTTNYETASEYMKLPMFLKSHVIEDESKSLKMV